jgi:uncharacterized protein YbgA (DUF1722 family)
MTESISDYEGALELLENHRYNAAANQIISDEDGKLKAELERLGELIGDRSKHVSGKLGQVISNYEDRLIDELAEKASEQSEGEQ